VLPCSGQIDLALDLIPNQTAANEIQSLSV
jgi:hypothetical protein